MFCFQCGAQVGSASKFCPKCGASDPTVSSAKSAEPPSDIPNILRRVAELDVSVFGRIRDERALTVPATIVAAVAMFLFGFGGYLWAVVKFESSSDFLLDTAVLGSLFGALLWAGGVAIIYLLLRGATVTWSDAERVLRVTGFASMPLGLGVLMVIPAVSMGVALLAVVLFFTYEVIALIEAFELPPRKSVITVTLGFAPWALILPLLASGDHAYAPGIFVFDTTADYVGQVEEAFRNFQY